MPTPAAKRRRIDTASQTLSKPFRSPFKSPIKAPQSTSSSSHGPSVAAYPHITSSDDVSVLPILQEKTPNLPFTTPNRTSQAKKTFSSPLAVAVLNADEDIAPLLRAQRALERQLREVKDELEQAEQARKIENESLKGDPDGEVDADLLMLIEKWRGASRLAAEELFGKVRDRVNRMGGPRAWKKMQQKQQDFQNSWVEEDQNDIDADGDSDASKKNIQKTDLYAEYGIDPETEIEKSQRETGVGDTGELPGQEDEFTMAMMLRTLNVDLDIVGYNKLQQKWVD